MAHKRLLFGNPKPLPLKRVRFLRITRYKPGYFEPHPTLRQSGWEILTPPRGPSWIEREGLMSPSEVEWERRGREGIIGQVSAYWWSKDQWQFSFGPINLRKNWDDIRGSVKAFGFTLWQNPKQPKTRRISKRELREWIKTQRPFL